MYLGNGRCVLFRNLTSRGWSKSFANSLIVTTLAKTFRAANKPLYKQPSLYIQY